MAPQPPRIAVLGASLSGLAAVQELVDAAGQQTAASGPPKAGRRLQVDIFRSLYDPAEPGWSYGQARKPYVDYVPERLMARDEAFLEQLRRWEAEGWVKAEDGQPFRVLRGSGAGPAEGPGASAGQGGSFVPEGGAMRLCERLAESLEGGGSSAAVRVRREWVWSLKSPGEGKGWRVRLGDSEKADGEEQYDFLLLSYDFCFRMHHVKSFRELLDSGLPHTEGLIGCFGQLHTAKCLAATFTVEPPLGRDVPWEAAHCEGNARLLCATRMGPCSKALWRKPPGAEHWMLLSTSAFARECFRPGWDKPGAFQQLLAAFEEVVGLDLKDRRVKLVCPCFHWDLPAPRNVPEGQRGLIADRANCIAWTGDFCVEPTPEGCWLAGRRAGQLLAGMLLEGSAQASALPSPGDLLPRWEYHQARAGDADVAALAFTGSHADSAYRGTCNWEQCERVMQARLRNGELRDCTALWLDHLPSGQQKGFAQNQRRALQAGSPKPVQPEGGELARPSAGPPGRGPGGGGRGGRALRVAVIGSGPAGLYCADRLAELAQAREMVLSGPVHLFRSRSKLSASQMEFEHNTCYPRPGEAFFDYGCQYITAGDAWFREQMQEYEAAGFCHRLPVGVLSKESGYEALDQGCLGWVGSQGMWVFQEQVVGHVSKSRRSHLQVHNPLAQWPPAPGRRVPDSNPLRVEKYEKQSDGTWLLRNGRNDTFGPFDVLVGAFDSHKHTHEQLSDPAARRMHDYLHANLRHSPVITAMVSFDRPLGLDFTAAFVVGDERLGWVCNNNAKVGAGVAFRADGRELWTFMAPAKYSCESFERDGKGYKRRAFEDFLAAFGKLLGGRDLWRHGPKLVRALHWEAGLPCTVLPSEAGCVFDREQQLGWCGHWAIRGGVEGAAQSGRRMAELIAGLSRGEEPPEGSNFPDGQWPDAGLRCSPGPADAGAKGTADWAGYVRLGNGAFWLPGAPQKLRSIEPPGASSLSAEWVAEFWGKHGAYGYSGGDGGKARPADTAAGRNARDGGGGGKGRGRGLSGAEASSQHRKVIVVEGEEEADQRSSKRRWTAGANAGSSDGATYYDSKASPGVPRRWRRAIGA